jgi:hypothetical protein
MNNRRKFVKTIVLAVIILASALALSAQNACELESKTAPLLLNLRLGMSPEQVQGVFSRDLKVKIKKKGERTFFQNYIKKPAPPTLSGVRALYLRFFDRQLYQIEIFYEPRAGLQSLEEIKGALSSQLNLPISDWETKNNRAQIVCPQASLITDSILNPRLELTNEPIRAKVKEAREKDKK